MAENPFPWNIPSGPDLCVENPDGVFMGATHSLYDTGPLAQPVIPGNYDVNRIVSRPSAEERGET